MLPASFRFALASTLLGCLLAPAFFAQPSVSSAQPSASDAQPSASEAAREVCEATDLPATADLPELDDAQNRAGRVAILPTIDSALVDDLAAFEIWLQEPGEPATRRALTAKAWHDLPEGTYDYWAEGNGWISPAPMRLRWPGAETAREPLVLVVPLRPATRVEVALPEASSITGHPSAVHLLHFRPESSRPCDGEPELLREFLRVETIPAAEAGVHLPQGEVVAALWDEKRGEYLALSPRRTGSAGAGHSTQRRQPRAPAAGSTDLLVTVERASVRANEEGDTLRPIVIDGDGRKHTPDQIVGSAERVRAVFYGLPSGHAVVVHVESTDTWAAPIEVPLRSGKVETVEIQTEPRPQLAVSFDLPRELEDAPRDLFLLDEGKLLERRDDVTGTQTFLAPPLPLTIAAQIGPHQVMEPVDLSDGRDAEVTLAPELYRLSGTVYYGKDPHPATLTILTGDQIGVEARGEAPQPVVEAGEDGDYSILLTQPAYYMIQVQLEGRDTAAVRMTEVNEPEQEFDIHLAANEFSFHVTDAETGEAIEGAWVTIANEVEGFQSMLRGETDKEGMVLSGPLDPGTLMFMAGATDYLTSPKQSEEIPESEVEIERLYEIALEPEGSQHPVQLLLADGSPAAGARIGIPVHEYRSWGTTTDGSGTAQIPTRFLGLPFYVSHPQAAVTITVLTEQTDQWSLEAPAPPLQIRALNSAEEPMRHCWVFLQIDGYRLGSAPLAMVNGRTASTDDHGLWTFQRPPARDLPVLLVCRDHDLIQQAQLGALDSQATLVAYPWPDEVVVRPIGQ